ncbi:DUF664 domain-containing protein [Streptomyces sp. NPDC005181]|uniref:mycothiol transferase n=1 Tax=Streptomyces sp. NPDC005181 TaxID=3156869 RepID=UPI0033AC6715
MRPPGASWSSRPTRSAPTPTRPAATSRSSSSSSSRLRAATGRRQESANRATRRRPGTTLTRHSCPRVEIRSACAGVYVLMVQEYARHNGHPDFLRERFFGATGD